MAKKKDKARRRQKKRQKDALKARRRAKEKQKALAQQRHQDHSITEEQFSDDDMLFWICHGINYLVSDYRQGLWKPLFDIIYEDPPPEPDLIVRAVMHEYGEDTEVLEGKAALAWTLQGREQLYSYAREALRRVKEKNPDCRVDDLENKVREPHNSQVWELFDQVKQAIAREYQTRS